MPGPSFLLSLAQLRRLSRVIRQRRERGKVITQFRAMAGPGISLQDLQERYQLSETLLDAEVSEEHLEDTARIVGDHEILSTALGLASAEVGQGKRPEILRLEMLRRWKQKLVWKATYRVLTEALLKWDRADYARDIVVLLAQSKYNYRSLDIDLLSQSPLIFSSLMVAGAPPKQPSACAGHSAALPTSAMSPDGATSTDGLQHGVFSSYSSSTLSCFLGSTCFLGVTESAFK